MHLGPGLAPWRKGGPSPRVRAGRGRQGPCEQGLRDCSGHTPTRGAALVTHTPWPGACGLVTGRVSSGLVSQPRTRKPPARLTLRHCRPGAFWPLRLRPRHPAALGGLPPASFPAPGTPASAQSPAPRDAPRPRLPEAHGGGLSGFWSALAPGVLNPPRPPPPSDSHRPALTRSPAWGAEEGEATRREGRTRGCFREAARRQRPRRGRSLGAGGSEDVHSGRGRSRAGGPSPCSSGAP